MVYFHYYSLIGLIEQHDFFFFLLLENNHKLYLSFVQQLWSIFLSETLKNLANMRKFLFYFDVKYFSFGKNKSKKFKLRNHLIVAKSNFLLILNSVHLVPISIIHLKVIKNIRRNCPDVKKCNLYSFKIIDKKKTVKDVAIFIRFEGDSKITSLMVTQKRKILKISNRIIYKKTSYVEKKLFIYTKKNFNNCATSVRCVVKFLFQWNLIKLETDGIKNPLYKPNMHFEEVAIFFSYKNLLRFSYEIFLEHFLVSNIPFFFKKKRKTPRKRFFFYVINNIFSKRNLTFCTDVSLDISVLNMLFGVDNKIFDSKYTDKKHFFCKLQKCKLEIIKRKEKILPKLYYCIFLYKTIKIENLFLNLILEIIYLRKKHLNNTLKWVFYIKFNFNMMLCYFSNFLLQ
nr:hypothetical protein CparaKRNrm1_p011 [Cryptomonas paramecium]